LLALQVVDITLPFRIGHSFITTLCILRQPIVVLVALAVRHPSISTLFVPAEPSEFKVYRRVRTECARVAWVEPTIAIVARGASVPTPIGRLEPGAIVPPISLLRRLVIPACLILQTLSVTWIDHGVEAANDVANALRGARMRRECAHQCNDTRDVEQLRVE